MAAAVSAVPKPRATAARTEAAPYIGDRDYNQGLRNGRPLGDYNRMRVLPLDRVKKIETGEDDDRSEPKTMMGRARDLVSGRTAARREKNRLRAPRTMQGRRG